MKVEVIEKSKLGRELVFEVDKEKVDSERKKIIGEIQKEAMVTGFRKGKVPEAIIVTRFADDIRENLLKRLISDLYYDAIREKKINAIVEPSIYDVSLEDAGLKFKVYTEVKPDVVIRKYKSIPVRKRKPEPVAEKEVDEVLEQWEKRPEFKSAVIDPQKRKAWKDKIREQLEGYSRRKASMEEEEELWEGLLKESEFSVPEKLVTERAARYAEEHLGRMDLKEKTDEEKKKMAQEAFDKAKPLAEADIRKYFLLDKIAELEKIEAAPEDVDSRIENLGRSVGEPAANLKEKFRKDGRISEIEDDIRIDKAFAFLKENSQVIEKVILPGEEKRILTK